MIQWHAVLRRQKQGNTIERQQRQMKRTNGTKDFSAELSRLTFIAEEYTDIFTRRFRRSDTSAM